MANAELIGFQWSRQTMDDHFFIILGVVDRWSDKYVHHL